MKSLRVLAYSYRSISIVNGRSSSHELPSLINSTNLIIFQVQSLLKLIEAADDPSQKSNLWNRLTLRYRDFDQVMARLQIACILHLNFDFYRCSIRTIAHGIKYLTSLSAPLASLPSVSAAAGTSSEPRASWSMLVPIQWAALPDAVLEACVTPLSVIGVHAPHFVDLRLRGSLAVLRNRLRWNYFNASLSTRVDPSDAIFDRALGDRLIQLVNRGGCVNLPSTAVFVSLFFAGHAFVPTTDLLSAAIDSETLIATASVQSDISAIPDIFKQLMCCAANALYIRNPHRRLSIAAALDPFVPSPKSILRRVDHGDVLPIDASCDTLERLWVGDTAYHCTHLLNLWPWSECLTACFRAWMECEGHCIILESMDDVAGVDTPAKESLLQLVESVHKSAQSLGPQGRLQQRLTYVKWLCALLVLCLEQPNSHHAQSQLASWRHLFQAQVHQACLPPSLLQLELQT